MIKFKIILFLTLIIPKGIIANEFVDSISTQCTITNSLEELKTINSKDSISLDQIIILHQQLDSILLRITKNLDKESGLCFYITFMKCNDSLYLEIVEDYPNNYIFEIKEKGYSLHKREHHEIYGYIKYNNIDFYLLLYPHPCEPKKKDLNSLVCKTGNKVIINRKSLDFSFVQENPMWLYQYINGNINLIKSVNDKGFFTNP